MAADVKVRALGMWNEMFNAHDLDVVDDWVAEGAINHNAMPGTPSGPEGAKDVFGRLWSGFPDMRFEVSDLIADGEKVACVGMMSGTHKGQFMGIPPTEKSFTVRQIHVLSFDQAGKMTEHLAVRDDVAMLQQLGVMPSAPAG